MASCGLFLCSDGFFLHFGRFEKREPEMVRYRLCASLKEISFWNSEAGPQPDELLLELAQEGGWSYVAQLDQYFIYSTANPEAPELNSDPEIYAIALKEVQKRKRKRFILLLIYLLIYPLSYPLMISKSGVLLTMLSLGSGLFFLGIGLAVWCLLGSLIEIMTLNNYVKRLLNKVPLVPIPSSKKGWLTAGRKALFVVLSVIWIGAFFQRWKIEYMHEDEIPIEIVQGIPYPTMEDLLPQAVYTATDLSFTNFAKIGSDFLAPEIFTTDQAGKFSIDNGVTVSGGLQVTYYHLRNEFLAKAIAREMIAQVQRTSKKDWEDLSLSDQQVTTQAILGSYFPVIILQEKEYVFQILYYSTTPDSVTPNPINAETIAALYSSWLKKQ